VVVAIISVLAAMLLPALSKAREKARQTVCKNKLKQVGLAMRFYADDNDGSFPWKDSGHWRAQLTMTGYAPNPNSPVASEFYRCPNDNKKRVAFGGFPDWRLFQNRTTYVGNRGWKDVTSAGPHPERGPLSVYDSTARWPDLDNPERTILVTEELLDANAMISQPNVRSYRDFGQSVIGWEWGGIQLVARWPHPTRANFVFGDLHVELLDPRSTYPKGHALRNGTKQGFGKKNLWRMQQ